MWSPRWVLVASLVGCDSDVLIDGPVDWLGAPIGYDDAAAQIQLKVAAVAMASGVDKDENVHQIGSGPKFRAWSVPIRSTA